MPNPASFEAFEKELNRLVAAFGKRLAELKKPGYAEAQLRDDFLNPFSQRCQRGVELPLLPGTRVGDKWLCVVVKYAADDAFVLTAYLTDKPKKGEQLWPIK
jgi:hypothetical protein